jgi:hypothetical protein
VEQPAQEDAQPAEEPLKVEDAKSSPETKDSEVKKAPLEEVPNENEANGLDFDEME